MSVFPVLPSFKTICSYNTPFSRGMTTIVATAPVTLWAQVSAWCTDMNLSCRLNLQYVHSGSFLAPWKRDTKERDCVSCDQTIFVCRGPTNQICGLMNKPITSNDWQSRIMVVMVMRLMMVTGGDGDKADDDHGWWWWLWRRRRRRRFHSDAQYLPQDHFQIPSSLSFEEFQHWLLLPIHPN